MLSLPGDGRRGHLCSCSWSLARARAGAPSVEGAPGAVRRGAPATTWPRRRAKQKLTAPGMISRTAGAAGKWVANDSAEAGPGRPEADRHRVSADQAVFVVALGFMFGQFLGREAGPLGLLSALIFAVVGYFIPDWYVKFRQGKRLSAFNDQLSDTITLLANSLRSGYSFLQSMEMVARESPPPMGAEFRRVIREVGLGLSTQDALNNLVRRMPSEDLDLMITAVNIQQEVGGNLAVILDTIGHTIRERVRIKGEIRTLTAMGRVSGYLVAFLPIGIMITLNFINPEFMQPLFTETHRADPARGRRRDDAHRLLRDPENHEHQGLDSGNPYPRRSSSASGSS